MARRPEFITRLIPMDHEYLDHQVQQQGGHELFTGRSSVKQVLEDCQSVCIEITRD